MFAASLVALAALPAAFAAISITNPTATSTWAAGQQQTISWIDDGTSPSLANMSVCMVSIYTGNVNTQIQLQLITNNVDVSTTSSVAFTPDASIGPNGDDYFIRFESLTLKDATNTQFFAEAFSAKFTLSSMTGTFNSTVQALVDGASSGSTSATSAASGATSASASATSAASSKAASSASGSKTSASASSTSTTTSGASGLFASVGLVGTVAAALGSMLL